MCVCLCVPLMFFSVFCALASESSSTFILEFKYCCNCHFFFCITQQPHDSWSVRHASERDITFCVSLRFSAFPIAVIKILKGMALTVDGIWSEGLSWSVPAVGLLLAKHQGHNAEQRNNFS